MVDNIDKKDDQLVSKIFKSKVSKYQFYFGTPLYEWINLDGIEDKFMQGSVDGYNSISGFDTTYEISTYTLGHSYSSYYTNFYLVNLICKRNERDLLRFFVYKSDKDVVKLGQFPSLADIQFAEIGKKYDKVLNKNALFEFKRGIGLAAYGVCAGSFVYLRRIFESLISETFQNNKSAMNIKEEEFNQKRMEDKILLLKDHLPSQLVEMRSIYSILSKGIHELSEDECLTYFEPLKLSIELILEQKIEMDLKRKRDKRVKEEIINIQKKLAK